MPYRALNVVTFVPLSWPMLDLLTAKPEILLNTQEAYMKEKLYQARNFHFENLTECLSVYHTQ